MTVFPQGRVVGDNHLEEDCGDLTGARDLVKFRRATLA